MAKELTSLVAKPGHMGGGRAAGLVLPARVGVISDDPMALPPPSIKEWVTRWIPLLPNTRKLPASSHP